MNRVEFSMDPKWIPFIEDGRKRATTRIKRKAEPGDVFVLNGWLYRITNVVEVPLIAAKFMFHDSEGFDTPEEYVEAVRSYYPDLGDRDTVYVHVFEPINRRVM